MQIYISKDNRQWGPYEAKQVSFLLGKGSFALQDWAWVEGGTKWIPVSQVLEMLCREEQLQEEITHQKVEVAKKGWRSKLTSPISDTNEPVLVAQAVHQKPVLVTAIEGSWWRQNFFYTALGFGITGFVAMFILSGPDVEDFNSLINEGGLAYEQDSTKPFDGKAVTHYPNGKLMYEAEYKEGKQHGKIFSFYENGSKQSEGAMENGIFHGKVIHYHPNGQIQSHYIYRKGNAISRKNWDETGKAVVRGE